MRMCTKRLQIDALRRKRRMAKIYVRRIKAGAMTIHDVPEIWREQVRQLLEQEA